jgi:putative transposase
LRKLRRRSVKLVVSDAHEGIKSAVAKPMNAAWRRCRVHAVRNVLAYAEKAAAGSERTRTMRPFFGSPRSR